jgi:hypothetical protein
MVRKYIRKKCKSYTSENLQEALHDIVENELSIRETARKYNIPLTTLNDFVNQRHTKPVGPPTVLSKEEEEMIVKVIIWASECGWPFNRADLADIVKQYCNSVKIRVPWSAKTGPGVDFIRSFENRWKHRLSQRKPELMTLARSKNLNSHVIDHFFKLIEDLYNKYGFHTKPHMIYNLDETGLNTDQGGKVCYFKKGMKDTPLLSPTNGKTFYTVLACSSASGEIFPPFIIYKAKHLHDIWCKGGFEGTSYSVTSSGWMEQHAFTGWLKDVFIVHKKKIHGDEFVLLYLDGHSSHISFEIADICFQNNVVLVCLPPNTSHALQPLDVGFFKPLKDLWKKILRQWYRESRLTKVEKSNFPLLLAQLWRQLKGENSVAGFRGSGLFPLNKHKPLSKIIGKERETYSLSTSSSENSPIKKLKAAVFDVLTPPLSNLTKSAIQNGKSRRRRIQAVAGEVFTEDTARKRLYNEMQSKQHQNTGKKAKLSQPLTCCNSMKKNIIPIIGDGNCLFNAVSKAYYQHCDKKTSMRLREYAAHYIVDNWLEFDAAICAVHKISNSREYLKKMQSDGYFADETEVKALSKVLNIRIEVFTSDDVTSSPLVVHNEDSKNIIQLYYKNEHYDLIVDQSVLNQNVLSHEASMNDDIKVGSWVLAKVMKYARGRNIQTKKWQLYIGKVCYII